MPWVKLTETPDKTFQRDYPLTIFSKAPGVGVVSPAITISGLGWVPVSIKLQVASSPKIK